VSPALVIKVAFNLPEARLTGVGNRVSIPILIDDRNLDNAGVGLKVLVFRKTAGNTQPPCLGKALRD
jgi:hypothetical protein